MSEKSFPTLYAPHMDENHYEGNLGYIQSKKLLHSQTASKTQPRKTNTVTEQKNVHDSISGQMTVQIRHEKRSPFMNYTNQIKGNKAQKPMEIIASNTTKERRIDEQVELTYFKCINENSNANQNSSQKQVSNSFEYNNQVEYAKHHLEKRFNHDSSQKKFVLEDLEGIRWLSDSPLQLPHAISTYFIRNSSSELKQRHLLDPEASSDFIPKYYVPRRRLILTLACILFIAALTNFDHGAIPPSLEGIAEQFKLSFLQQSLLGSLVYTGLIFGILVAGITLQHIEAKRVIVGSLLLLMFSIFCFSSATNISFLYCSRFLSGFAEAFPSVMIPVWVDEYGPLTDRVQWMSYVHLSTILGTTLGYSIAGFCNHRRTFPDKAESLFWQNWRTPFYIQGLCIIPVVLTLLFSDPNAYTLTSEYNQSIKYLGPELKSQDRVKSKNSTKENFQEYMTDAQTTFKGLCLYIKSLSRRIGVLFTFPRYIIVTFGISNLFFIVTGLQFWILQYLCEGMNMDKAHVIPLTMICFTTSPTIGVYVGSLLISWFHNAEKDLGQLQIRIITFLAFGACIASYTAAFTRQFWIFGLMLWLSSFFGAAVVPIAMTLSLSSVPHDSKSLASAVSQLIYNLFGWFAAPILSGAFMDILSAQGYESPLPLLYGFRLILFSSIMGLFCFSSLFIMMVIDETR